METLILFAGIGQLMLAAGSLAIPRVLHWREELERLTPLTRAVFWTYAGYIWATNVFLGIVSTLAPRAWLERSTSAQALCAYAALYWIARIAIQVGWFARVYTPIAPRLLRYRENLSRLSPVVREIFIVHSLYIVLVVIAFSLLCFLFPQDLAGASSLGRFLSLFLGVFWGLRLAIQFWVYDAEIKREHPIFATLFTLSFLYLTLIFACAAALAQPTIVL